MDRLRPLWDFGDLDATSSRLLEQLGSEPDDDGRAEVLTQLARVEGLRSDFESAERLLGEAEALGSSPVVGARVALESGRVLRSSGDPEAAFPLFVAAYDTALGAREDFIAADAAHMAAIVDPSWAERGIELAERSTDAAYWLGPIWNNLGWSRLENGDAAGALDAFERALAARDREPQIGVARYAVARALRELGRSEEAVQQLERAVADAPAPDPWFHEELSENYALLGLDDEARANARIAEELRGEGTSL
ncbi:MAG TPA: tetratricopeptide repeat protein [Gaiellaceae bacterium]|nr:tetratricopeptide repeat protein [Gaiellaceae bacterium]